MDLNIVTFIFFALAVVIFIQLRNVLGRRTGNERPPFDPYAIADEAVAEKADNKTADFPVAEKADPYAVIDAYTPAGTPLNEALRAIADADENFVLPDFLRGAKGAYEMILTAFAKGELSQLKRLLADNVYADFVEAIEMRQKAGEVVKFSFIGLDEADIVHAALEEGEVRISISFKAEIVSATYNQQGEKVDGDEQDIVVLQDRWTFARNVKAKAPDWLLVATEEEFV